MPLLRGKAHNLFIGRILSKHLKFYTAALPADLGFAAKYNLYSSPGTNIAAEKSTAGCRLPGGSQVPSGTARIPSGANPARFNNRLI
jgi:hypothetical protein